MVFFLVRFWTGRLSLSSKARTAQAGQLKRSSYRAAATSPGFRTAAAAESARRPSGSTAPKRETSSSIGTSSSSRRSIVSCSPSYPSERGAAKVT